MCQILLPKDFIELHLLCFPLLAFPVTHLLLLVLPKAGELLHHVLLHVAVGAALIPGLSLGPPGRPALGMDTNFRSPSPGVPTLGAPGHGRKISLMAGDLVPTLGAPGHGRRIPLMAGDLFQLLGLREVRHWTCR